MNRFDPTDEQVAVWEQWLSERPDDVREIASRFRPWRKYRLKSTGQDAVFVGVDELECGCLTLRVLAGVDGLPIETWNQVFGISPSDLIDNEMPPRGHHSAGGVTG